MVWIIVLVKASWKNPWLKSKLGPGPGSALKGGRVLKAETAWRPRS